jgi:hypothetical protein
MHGRTALFHHGRWWLRVGRWLTLALALGACVYAHWQTTKHAIAQPAAQIDPIELRCLNLALETRPDLTPDFSKGVSQPLEEWAPRRTDGVINPLFPWLAGWQVAMEHAGGPTDFVSEDDQRIMIGGKLMLASLVGVFIVMLGLTCARTLSLPTALVVAALCAWGAIFPVAQRFAPDALFKVLFMITWTSCLLAMPRNSLWAYAVVGVTSGLTYLAEESVHVVVVVFIVVTTLRWLWGWIAAHWPGEGGTTLWVRRNHFLGVFLLVALHLLTIGPRLHYAYQEYGEPFHSLRWQALWLDTPEEVQSLLKGNRDQGAEKPSWRLYAASHTNEEVWTRLSRGMTGAWRALWSPEASSKDPVRAHRGLYAAVMALVLALLAVILVSLRKEEGHAGQRLHPETATMVLFVVASLFLHLVAGAWTLPVLGEGPMIGALFAPLVLSLAWGSESLLRRSRRRHASFRVFLGYELTMWLLLAAIAWPVIEGLRSTSFGP